MQFDGFLTSRKPILSAHNEITVTTLLRNGVSPFASAKPIFCNSVWFL